MKNLDQNSKKQSHDRNSQAVVGIYTTWKYQPLLDWAEKEERAFAAKSHCANFKLTSCTYNQRTQFGPMKFGSTAKFGWRPNSLQTAGAPEIWIEQLRFSMGEKRYRADVNVIWQERQCNQATLPIVDGIKYAQKGI